MRLLALFMPLLAAATLPAIGVDINHDGRIAVLWVVPQQPDGDAMAADRAAAAIQAMAAGDQRRPFTITVVTNSCETLAGAAWFPEGRSTAQAVADARFDAVILSERTAALAEFPAISYAAISALRKKLPSGSRLLLHQRGESTPKSRDVLRLIASGTRSDIIAEDTIRETNAAGAYTRAFRGSPEAIDEYLTAATFYSLIFRNRFPPFLEPADIVFTERHQRVLAQMIQKTADTNRRPAVLPVTGAPPARAATIISPSLAKGTRINEAEFFNQIRESAANRTISLPIWPVFFENIAPSPLWKNAAPAQRKEAIEAMDRAMRMLISHGIIEALPETASLLTRHCTRSGIDFLLRMRAFSDEANATVITPNPLAFHLWRRPTGITTLRIAPDLNSTLTLSPGSITFTTIDFDTPHPVEITRADASPATLLWSVHATTFPGIRSGSYTLPSPAE